MASNKKERVLSKKELARKDLIEKIAEDLAKKGIQKNRRNDNGKDGNR